MKKYFLSVLFATLLAAPLPIFAANANMTPMQAAARQLQTALTQALEQSSLNARQRYHLSQDAAVLVKASDQRAQGQRMDRRELRNSAKALIKAFDSGSFQVGDVSMLNSDFNQFKHSIR